ncbi:MAG: glycosyltransferase family 9 protein [Candidatus Eisenbacteria bacterium]
MEYLFLVISAFVSLIVNGRGMFRRSRIERVLVFKLDHIGDVVTATPALDHLRDAYPGAEITLVVGPWSAPLIEGHPSVDRLVVHGSRAFARNAPLPSSPSLRTLLPRDRYDLVVGLRDDKDSLAVSLGVGAVHRVDRGTVRIAEKLRRRRGALRTGASSESMHEVETNLRIVGASPPPGGARPRLFVRKDAEEWAKVLVAGRPEFANGYVVLHPGAHSPLRHWPADRFGLVARWVRKERGLGVVVTGSTEEAGLASNIAAEGGEGVLDLAGKTTLSRAVAMIAGARAMVSVDTGLMHVATAVGTPVVALVGPEDPSRFGPYGPDHLVVDHRYPCSPCDQVHCVRASNECMEAITVAEVIRALSSRLDLRPWPGRSEAPRDRPEPEGRPL